MGMPRLIYFENNARISEQVSSDMQLRSILSKPAVAVLFRPLGVENLKKRRELFSWLASGDNRGRLARLLYELKDYKRICDIWHECKIPVEERYRHAGVLKAYLNICESLSAFSGEGGLLSEVSAYFLKPEIKNPAFELRSGLKEIDEILKSMQIFCLSFSDKDWITPDTDAVGYREEIAVIAGKLGLVTPFVGESISRPTLSLSGAMSLLFSERLQKLDALLGQFDAINFSEPIVLIDDISFYLEIDDLIKKAESKNIPICFPDISSKKQFSATDLYDVSLFKKDCNIVPNDAWISEKEPFFYLTGANGGGKTTYLRALGINLLLFLAGCPIFARRASIYPFTSVFTHFPVDEKFINIGRLDEEAARMDAMLKSACGCSFFLLNESFSGTDEEKGYLLLCDTTEKIIKAGHCGLCVTHFHQAEKSKLPLLSAQTEENDEHNRTYRIFRKDGESFSFARDILKKYHIDRASLNERRKSNEI